MVLLGKGSPRQLPLLSRGGLDAIFPQSGSGVLPLELPARRD
jgi:hypothetical protein